MTNKGAVAFLKPSASQGSRAIIGMIQNGVCRNAATGDEEKNSMTYRAKEEIMYIFSLLDFSLLTVKNASVNIVMNNKNM